MQIYKVLPSLRRGRVLSLWHKALRSQWSPEEIDWAAPGTPAEAHRDRLARILTPLLMGEQAALYSITAMIQALGRESDVESQFYLTTMAVDEARHTELFTRYFLRIEREPLSIRRFPTGYLFQSRIMADNPVDWITGSLVSEVIAKLTLEELERADLDPVLTEICARTLEDEARHLGFDHVSLEERSLHAARAGRGEAWAEHLSERLAYVLAGAPPMLEDLAQDLGQVGIDHGLLNERLVAETRRRLEHAVASGLAKAAAPSGSRAS